MTEYLVGGMSDHCPLPLTPTLQVRDGGVAEGCRQNGCKMTALEIEAVILTFPPNKSSDGFPAVFYKHYMEQLAPRLSTLFSHCLENGVLPSSMLEAYMVLLLKLGKDPEGGSSYRSIDQCRSEDPN